MLLATVTRYCRLDKQKGIFSGNNYAIIKGEALALRAYLHFDLLGCLPTPINNPNGKGIPYVTTVGIKSTPFSSVQGCA
jgi:hypothetical protein